MLKKVLKIIFEVAIYALIIVGIVWGVPRFLSKKLGTEYPIAAITSGSMWPVLKQNDIVLIKAVPKEELKVGDIVVWQNEKGFTIHRVVELASTTLITKGDANFTKDEPVLYPDIIGRTVMRSATKPLRIPYFGYISVWSGKFRNSKVSVDGRAQTPPSQPVVKPTPGEENGQEITGESD